MRAVKQKTRDMTYIALFVVVMAVCAWISVPTAVPFTLQTLGVFLAVGVLGGKRGSVAVLVYLLMGAVGVPVFSGFTGGLGRLLHVTGGYLLGLLFCALVMWGMETMFGQRTGIYVLSMVLGLLVCYTFGTLWYTLVYAQTSGAVGLGTVLTWCVLPFLLPDAAKIALAVLISRRLRKLIQ